MNMKRKLKVVRFGRGSEYYRRYDEGGQLVGVSYL